MPIAKRTDHCVVCCEPLESRTLLHGTVEGAIYPLGTLVAWTFAPLATQGLPISPPATSAPPGSPPTVGRITGLKLVDAGSDVDLRTLAAGDTLNRAAADYSVRVETAGGVGSVAFLLNGSPFRTDNAAPFTAAPTTGGDYAAWQIGAGSHVLTVIPYATGDATGPAGDAYAVSFTVVEQSSVVPGFSELQYTVQANSPIERSEALRGVYNGRVYVFGGFSGTRGPVTDSHYFNPSNNSWTAITPTPEPITHAGVAQTASDVYFVGGYIGNGRGYGQVFGSNRVWKYNFASDSYARVADLPQKYAGGGAEILNGQLHYFGGYNLDRTDTNIHLTLNLNDPSATWQGAPSMPSGRNHLGHVVFGGKIYAIAGQTGTDEGLVVQRDVQIFDPTTSAWTSGKPIPRGVSHVSSATFVMGERIIVMGGESAHNQQVRDVWAYTPATDAWQALTALPAARFSGVAAGIDGKILFTTGGRSTTTWLATPA